MQRRLKEKMNKIIKERRKDKQWKKENDFKMNERNIERKE